MAALVALTLPGSGAGGGHKDRDKHATGFKTSQPAMITPVAPGVAVNPIINVGESVGGYTFDSIPDGISLAALHGGNKHKLKEHGGHQVALWLNHELSLVPFPIRTPPALTESDEKNAELSELILDREGAGVLSGRFVIPSSANYQRFCSNFLATKKQGFEFRWCSPMRRHPTS